MDERVIKASEFKAKCLKLMEEVDETGLPLTITKNGRPIAQLMPMPERRRSALGLHKGRGEILGDIISPIYPDWEPDSLSENGSENQGENRKPDDRPGSPDEREG